MLLLCLEVMYLLTRKIKKTPEIKRSFQVFFYRENLGTKGEHLEIEIAILTTVSIHDLFFFTRNDGLFCFTYDINGALFGFKENFTNVFANDP